MPKAHRKIKKKNYQCSEKRGSGGLKKGLESQQNASSKQFNHNSSAL